MLKIQKQVFWSFEFLLLGFVSCFVLRILDFCFRYSTEYPAGKPFGDGALKTGEYFKIFCFMCVKMIFNIAYELF